MLYTKCLQTQIQVHGPPCSPSGPAVPHIEPAHAGLASLFTLFAKQGYHSIFPPFLKGNGYEMGGATLFNFLLISQVFAWMDYRARGQSQ